MNLRNQFRKRGKIPDRRCSEPFRFGKSLIDRREIILLGKFWFLSVDRPDPIGERFWRRNFPAQTSVIEMAMRVDQARNQRLLAKIDNFTGVARFDFVEQSNIDNGAGGSRAT